LAALGRLPYFRNFGLGRENYLKGGSIGGAVNTFLSRGKLDALFAL
jgi:hypothetical protein